MKAFLSLTALIFVAANLHAATRSWTNTLGGNWFTAANWSPNGVPGVLDTANITNNGTYTVTIGTGTVAIANMNLGGASGTQTLLFNSGNSLAITNSGTIRANGLLNFADGNLSGVVNILTSGRLEFSGAATKGVYQLRLNNQGTVTWSGGQLNGGNTPTTIINNSGLWDITGNNAFVQGIGGPTLVFTNTGTLRKTVGTGTSSFNTFNLFNLGSGQVQVQTGTLNFNNGSSNVLGGTLSATDPATLSITGGTWTDGGGVATGSGTVQFAGGVLNLRTNIIPGLRHTGGNIFVTGTTTFQQAGAITNLTLDGSLLSGTNRVGTGTLTINSGGADGLLTVLPTGNLLLTNSASKSLYQLRLNNQGTVNWANGQLNGGNTPTTVISNGGLWMITGNNAFVQGIGGSPLIWTNVGTLRKTVGTGTSSLNTFNFFNRPSGLVEVLTGTLTFNNSTTNEIGGTFNAVTPGAILINGGTWTDAGGVATGSGVVEFANGTLNLRTNIIPGLRHTGGNVSVTGTTTFQQAGAITNLTLDGSLLVGTNRVGSGTLTINSGGAAGLLTILPTGQLLFDTAATKSLYQLRLNNQGTVNWVNGQLNGGNTPTTVISNGGLWHITGNNPFVQGIGGPAMIWTNSGTLRKSIGAGTSSLNTLDFINLQTGLVEALNGTLSFNGSSGSILGGTLSAVAPGTISITGGTWTDSAGVATGSGTVQFAGGTLNLRTNIIPGLLLVGGNVFVTGTTTFQQAGAITNLTLDGSLLMGSSRVGAGILRVNSGGVEGHLTILPPGQLLFETAATKSLYQLKLDNQGTVNWVNGQLNGGNTPTTVISNGGLWQITGNNPFVQGIGGPSMIWSNTGTLRKSVGTGTSSLNTFDFVNRPGALIEALTGTLNFAGTASNIIGGTLSATAPGMVSINSGTWTDAGGTAGGTGVVRFDGGTLNLRTNIIPGLRHTGGSIYVIGNTTFQQAGTITNLTLDGSLLRGTNRLGGLLTMNGGGSDGRLTILPTGELLFTNSATKSLYSLKLDNQGTVTWADGQLNGGNSPTTVVSNGGLWKITGSNPFVQGIGGPEMIWTNTGRLHKTAGTGTSSLNTFNIFNQPSGVIQTDIGTLQFSGSYTNLNGAVRLNGGRFAAGSTLGMTGGSIEGNGTLGGSLISLAGGTLSPGTNSIGRIGVQAPVALNAGLTFSVSGTGTIPGTQYDQLSVTGSVTIANATLQVPSLPVVPNGTTFVIIENDGADAVTGNFSGLPENTPLAVGGQSFRVRYTGGTGNDVVLVKDGGAVVGPQLGSGGYSNGVFRVTGNGSASGVYTIQATTNFTVWTTIGSTTGNISGQLIFTDTNAFKYPYRFYRAY